MRKKNYKGRCEKRVIAKCKEVCRTYRQAAMKVYGLASDMREQYMEIAYMRLMSYYRCAMMEIETKFNVLNEEFQLQFDRQPINSIHTRLKNPLSIRQKLMDRGLEPSVESIEQNLNDIAGIRVVCSFTEDVYKMAEALLKQDDITLIKKKDYIQTPKPNGYRSLHLIVAVPIFLQHEKRIMKAEVQLRTIAMDSWASLEHQLRYKKDVEFDEHMLWELRYCANLSAQLDERMDALRVKVGGAAADKQEGQAALVNISRHDVVKREATES